MVVGYFLGCLLAVQLAENWLDKYLKLIAVQESASTKEALDLLNVLKSSHYPTCSDAEIAYFRELVFRSEYLKDAGRMHGGKIECSATAGRPPREIGEFKPSTAQPDGAIAYGNLVPIRDETLRRAGLQMGNAYVVFGSQMPTSVGPFPIRLTTTVKEDTGLQSGSRAEGATGDKDPVFTTEGTVREGDNLYATRCSTLRANCVTASTTVSEALQGERANVFAGAIFGGLFGVFLGVGFSFAHRRSLNMEQQLRRAIANDKLQVAYQPIVSLGSGRIVGAEALARWTNEDGDSVNPDVFVKIAEENGFVGSITRLVVRRTLHTFADALRKHAGFRLSINVAAADLADPSFLPMLDDSLKKAKVQPESLVIEITESSTANRDVAMETIRMLRRRGHSVHIDDFGTGYSSLSYLLYLSVDTIKIDKAFTRAIGTESVTVAILPQILAMAKSLNLEVVVEGVETIQQADYFSAAKLPVYGQGWLYGRPVSAENFLAMLTDDVGTTPVLDGTVAKPVTKAASMIVGRRLTA